MPDAVVKPIRGPMLKRAIEQRVKRLITERKLGPGDLLPPEGQLAEDLGVSRGSVREAVKALESLGIVEVRHGDGVRVREFNFDSILDFLSYGLVFQPTRVGEILQIREWLEAAAMATVAETITDAELDEVDALLAGWESKAVAGKPTAQDDRSFHRLLYASLGNASLLNLIDIFWVVYHALPVQKIGPDADPLETVRTHRDIAAALRARDPELARQRMSAHFRNIAIRLGRASASAPDAEARGIETPEPGRVDAA